MLLDLKGITFRATVVSSYPEPFHTTLPQARCQLQETSTQLASQSLCHIRTVGQHVDPTYGTRGVVQMPAATTLCIANVQAEEAKVEALMDSFVSLRSEAALGGAKAGPEDTNNYFLYADDAEDNYQARYLVAGLPNAIALMHLVVHNDGLAATRPH